MKNFKAVVEGQRRANARFNIQEWLAVETILRNFFTDTGKWTPGTLAHAMFREEPVLFTYEDFERIARRRWPRHMVRFVNRHAEKAGVPGPPV